MDFDVNTSTDGFAGNVSFVHIKSFGGLKIPRGEKAPHPGFAASHYLPSGSKVTSM